MNPFGILLYAAPALTIAAVIGFRILTKYRYDDLTTVAGLFTLKPLIATPIWVFLWTDHRITSIQVGPNLYKYAPFAPPYLLTLLPGVVLTLALIIGYRSVFFRSPSKTIFVLLGLDCARWANSFLTLPLAVLQSPLCGLTYILGFTLPAIYAYIALVLVRKYIESKADKPLEDTALTA